MWLISRRPKSAPVGSAWSSAWVLVSALSLAHSLEGSVIIFLAKQHPDGLRPVFVCSISLLLFSYWRRAAPKMPNPQSNVVNGHNGPIPSSSPSSVFWCYWFFWPPSALPALKPPCPCFWSSTWALRKLNSII